MSVVFKGKHLVVRERDGWEYAERKKATEAVAVLAVTGEGQIVLTEQYRRPLNARVIDFPAGLVGDEEDHADAAATARKELEEETGFTCDSVTLVLRGPTSPGITSEVVSIYEAHGARRAGSGGGVGGEEITVHLVEEGTIREWLRGKEREGILIDMKLALWFFSR